MLFGIKLLFLKSQAAVCLQNELEHTNFIIPSIFQDPAKEANKIIENFCESHIGELEAANKGGGLPHKLTLAAISSAVTYEVLASDLKLENEEIKESILFVLIKLLNRINSQDRRLRDVDYLLLKKCNEIAMNITVEKSPIPMIPDDLKDYQLSQPG